MIELLTGILVTKEPHHCIVDVNGVGYGVSLSLTTFAALPEVGGQIKLNIYTHVREDQFTLFGFATPEEKVLFQKLIGVSGVGPKTALAMLSGIPSNHLVEAISSEDKARLSTIPGVGKKTAERIIIELRDKIRKDVSIISPSFVSERGRNYEDIVSALTNLGYQRGVAELALKKSGWSDEMSIEDSIRSALKELCRA